MFSICASEKVDRKTLHTFPIPEKGCRSDRWVGINHGDFADLIVNKVKEAEMKITDEAWYCNKTHNLLIGAVTIKPESIGVKLPGMDFSIGTRHSNDCRYAITIATGANVFICENGMLVAEQVVSQRHTIFKDVETLVEEGIRCSSVIFSKFEGIVRELKDTPVSMKTASALMFDAFHAQLIPFRYLEDIDIEWRKPRHEEFHDRTLWSLYNSFTEVSKRLSPQNQYVLMQGLYPLFEKTFQLKGKQ